MSLSFSQLKPLIDEASELLTGAFLSQFSEPQVRTFQLTFQRDQDRSHVLLCLQAPFLRFHLTSQPQKGDSPFSRQIEKTLSGAILKNLILLNEDRIVQLVFKNHQRQISLIAELFPKRPNLYLVDGEMKIITSLNPVEAEHYLIPPKPKISSPQPPAIASGDIDRIYRQLERDAEKNHLKQLLTASLSNKLKKAKRLVSQYESELQRCLSWPDLLHEAQLLQANLYQLKRGMETITVMDWNTSEERTLFLDPAEDPKEIVEALFHRAKKFRAGVIHIEKFLEKAKIELCRLTTKLAEIGSLEDFALLSSLQQRLIPPSSKSSQAKTAIPFRQFRTAAGLEIYVGKNARDNEKLTFSFARGSDWWFHVADYPGSHIILKVRANTDPDQESILDAVQIALYYSKAKKHGEGEVTMAQRKFVTRTKKGKTGAVYISQHKRIVAKLDPLRYEQLKERGHITAP